MPNWSLRDDGIPVPLAASISGFERGGFTHLRAEGAFGPANSDPISRASLFEVAAAKGLWDAERLGLPRQRVLPVLKDIASSAIVQLARMELGRRSWTTRDDVPSSSVALLAEKMHSSEGLTDLQDVLAVPSRVAARFVIFKPEEAIFADLPHEADSHGLTRPFLDIWTISYQIRNHVGGILFHGARAYSSLAA